MIAGSIKNIVVMMFSTALFFFSMIFLMGMAYKAKMNNSISNTAAMEQANVDQWGLIPGNLGYNWERNFTLYQFVNTPQIGQTVQLATSKEFSFKVGRTFGSPQWQSTKSVIEYNETYTYEQQDLNDLDAKYSTINFGAYGAWHQMVNQPRYWLAWQSLTTIADLMFSSNMVYRFMAYNAYEYLFYDYNLVQAGVLGALSGAD